MERAASRRDISEPILHAMPRLGGDPDTPLVFDRGDAVGLRRIVEAQAIELVRLRRALTGARTTAERRLMLIRAGHVRVDDGDSKSERGTEDSEEGRELIVAIRRIQEDVRSIVEGSRWRRLGQRLGLARRLAWEGGDWRSPLADAHSAQAFTGDPLDERDRLLMMREELARSRWRQLGQRLGVAKRQAWEHLPPHVPSPRPPPMPSPAPPAIPADAAPARAEDEWFPEHAARRFLEECSDFGVEVVLDVGANAGQFARGVRRGGYQGQIVSFEPRREAHAALDQAAACDPLWDVVARCAVGAIDGLVEINVAAKSCSSSLLPMLAAREDAAPHAAYCEMESCAVITLDDFAVRSFADPMTTFGLRIATQGCAAAVLAGAERILPQVSVVLCEMSLVPPHEGAPSMPALSHLLAEQGFRCVALGPAFEDPRTGALLQVDGVFARRA